MKQQLIDIINSVYPNFIEYTVYSNGVIRIKRIGYKTYKKNEGKEAEDELLKCIKIAVKSMGGSN